MRRRPDLLGGNGRRRTPPGHAGHGPDAQYRAAFGHAFHTALRATGIDNRKPGCRAACLHSLRHSFATHRLTSWHREGADVQRLLPALSSYLGHGSVAATQVYVSMTPDLLDEASRRFERYVEHNPSPDAGQHPKGGTSHA